MVIIISFLSVKLFLNSKICFLGFCFVEYYTHEDAVDCVKYINGTKLDDRVIRTDLDPGFIDSRQFGRGKAGGQVRDNSKTIILVI